MVIILQQTTDNGKRFVSTVVEAEESSFTSNFSLGSQNSISERSAIYKQRIDSLFGRHTRLNPFKPNVEPFCIRIDGSNTPSSESSIQVPVGSTKASQLQQRQRIKFKEQTGVHVTTKVIREEGEQLLSSDEDDDYQKIHDKPSSVITDSLNNTSSSSSFIIKNNVKRVSSSSPHNVSSVRITCEDSDESPTPTGTAMICSSEENNCKPMSNESLMWRNGSYAESPCMEDKSYGLLGARSSPVGTLRFPVEYLGSVPVSGTTTALEDLQSPLRALYLNFLSGKNVMSGQLAITSEGLRFEAPKIRLVNPFTTIAVWAAIKFVARGQPIPTECAFMPLISDPEGQDKGRLFGRMNSELVKVYYSYVSNNSTSKGQFRNPPIFACVMREASFTLDCHAFACKCAEDAIVVAANLYQSLVDKMRAHKEGESGYGSLTRGSPPVHNSPTHPNRSSSSASSNGSPNEGSGNASSGSCTGGSDVPILGGGAAKKDNRVVFSDSESIVPVRPPRRKKKSSEVPSGNLKRYNSDDSVLLKIPTRRKSFKSGYSGPNHVKVKKRVQISTPEESSPDAANESIDQILDRIINPGGMSFNDLKPSYQELILKIALTLTQDQLYQKSKQAMKKHQQFNFRKKSKSSPTESSDESSQFLNQLMKSFSKITSSKASSFSKSRPSSKASTTQSTTSCTPPKVILKKSKEEEPFMSLCSGCMCDKCSEKCYCSLPPKSNGKSGGMSSPSCTPSSPAALESTTPTDDLQSDKLKKSCGYDTDSCAESEKCYCSLQRVKSNGLKIYNINLDTETSDTDTNSYDFEPFNQPDTASSSNLKTASTRSVEMVSYQQSSSKRLSHSLSPTTSPPQVQTTNAVVHFEDKSQSPNILQPIQPKTSTSSSSSRQNFNVCTPYLQHLESSAEESAESSNVLQRQKVMLITGSSSSSRMIYKDANNYQTRNADFGDGKKSRNEQHRNLVDILEDDVIEDIPSDGLEDDDDEDDEDGLAPEKVLSMKKTAEIAAMFTDLRLDDTHIATDLASDHYDSANNTEESNPSVDFEASLGYLP